MQDEEEPKAGEEVNIDALEAVFEDEGQFPDEEDVVLTPRFNDEEVDLGIDLAFDPDDHDDW